MEETTRGKSGDGAITTRKNRTKEVTLMEAIEKRKENALQPAQVRLEEAAVMS